MGDYVRYIIIILLPTTTIFAHCAHRLRYTARVTRIYNAPSIFECRTLSYNVYLDKRDVRTWRPFRRSRSLGDDGDHGDDGGDDDDDRDHWRGDPGQRGRPAGPARGPGTVGRLPVQKRAGQAASRHVQIGGVGAQEIWRRRRRLHGGRRPGRGPGVRGHVLATGRRRPGGTVRVRWRPSVRGGHPVRGPGIRSGHHSGGQRVDGTPVRSAAVPPRPAAVSHRGTRVGDAARSAAVVRGNRDGRRGRHHRGRVSAVQETAAVRGYERPLGRGREAGRRRSVLGLPVRQIRPPVSGQRSRAGRPAARPDDGRQDPSFGRRPRSRSTTKDRRARQPNRKRYFHIHRRPLSPRHCQPDGHVGRTQCRRRRRWDVRRRGRRGRCGHLVPNRRQASSQRFVR